MNVLAIKRKALPQWFSESYLDQQTLKTVGTFSGSSLVLLNQKLWDKVQKFVSMWIILLIQEKV
jgi:hypothetical protein